MVSAVVTPITVTVPTSAHEIGTSDRYGWIEQDLEKNLWLSCASCFLILYFRFFQDIAVPLVRHLAILL
jgi:hypothetical protein